MTDLNPRAFELAELFQPDEFDPAEVHRRLPGDYSNASAGFRLHPTELARRRTSCRTVVDLLKGKLNEFVRCCNACGSERSAIVAQTDRYGIPSRTAVCLACGLVYQADRLSAVNCDEFYANGHYRAITSMFTGVHHQIGQIRTDQVRYARGLIKNLAGYLSLEPGAKVLDVGGSAGYVALEFQEFFNVNPTVLDPSEEEVNAAKRLGLEAIQASFEQWDTDQQFDLVLMCRSIEHVRDLRGVLSKIRRVLHPAGHLYCDFIDFFELCRLVGCPEAVAKIDHCFWLTQESAPGIFQSLGFEIVSLHLSSQPTVVGCLLRPCRPSAAVASDPSWILDQLRTVQRTTLEWQKWGLTPADARDWLHRTAYRHKRRIARFVSRLVR